MKFFIALKTFGQHIVRDDAIGIAAKTAFYFMLSLFPLTMIAGWVLSYTGRSLAALEGFLPADLLHIFDGAAMPNPIASPFLALGSLWAASSGVWALMRGVNAAYGGGRNGNDRLSFVRVRGVAILFTLGFLSVLALTIALLSVNRWMIMISVGGAIFLLLFALYTLTPGATATPARAAWTASLATVGWVAVSKAFEVYMRFFSRYDALYGSIGAFLGLALWVFLICVVVILGAELGALDM